MEFGAAWQHPLKWLNAHKPQLRFCLRLTLSAILAFTVAQLWDFPLRGLWAVLTAIVVTQMSIGGSLLAITEYVVGTLAGALYATAIALLLPHDAPLALVGVLALTVAPLALSAGFNSMFRVAPFTAAIVLLISTEYGESPIHAATYRILEVVVGGLSVIVVSFLVLPERAHQRGLKAAAALMDRLAQALPELLTGFSGELSLDQILAIQEELGKAVAQFQPILAETKRERLTYLHPHPETDLASLARTLLRLRHDFVIIGRAAVAPLSGEFLTRMPPVLNELAQQSADYLQACGAALTSGGEPPSIAPIEAIFAKHDAELSALRQDGFTRPLPSHEVERIFALGFALEGLHRHLVDLQRSIVENAKMKTT
jgi:uncharacterized membrane protein YccC